MRGILLKTSWPKARSESAVRQDRRVRLTGDAEQDCTRMPCMTTQAAVHENGFFGKGPAEDQEDHA